MHRPAMFLGLALGLVSAVPLAAQPIGYSVRSDIDDNLYSINLTTGVATAIGPVGFGDVEALAFNPATGVLYGIDDATNQLITINVATGAGTAVGLLGVAITDMGLSFDCSGNLFMSTDVPGSLYRINTATGAATLVGAQGQQVTGLAFSAVMWGLGGDGTNNLVTLNTTTGAATPVGALGLIVSDGGIDFDTNGVLWGINDQTPSQIFTMNRTTGAAAIVSTVTIAAVPASGFESLAIPGAGGCGCAPHTIHGHISTAPPTHTGAVSHEHHGTHGHVVVSNCPPHAPGHSPGLLLDRPDDLFLSGLTFDGSEMASRKEVTPAPGDASGAPLIVRRGQVLELSEPATELDSSNFRPSSFGPQRLTALLPEVSFGGVPAQVLFSGMAHGASVWQISVRAPNNVSAGPVEVTIRYAGREVRTLEVLVE